MTFPKADKGRTYQQSAKQLEDFLLPMFNPHLPKQNRTIRIIPTLPTTRFLTLDLIDNRLHNNQHTCAESLAGLRGRSSFVLFLESQHLACGAVEGFWDLEMLVAFRDEEGGEAHRNAISSALGAASALGGVLCEITGVNWADCEGFDAADAYK